MFEENDADTVPGPGQASSELFEAVVWLRQQGFLTGEERPFESLLRDADCG